VALNRPRLDLPSDLPPGLMNGLLFFAVVVVGSSYIIASKLNNFGAFAVTAVPVLIMIAYAVVLGGVRLFHLRDDQSGDNLYYMGFLFTLTSLAVSLYQFSATRAAEEIVQNFGIAIGSTITGIGLRVIFNQMRRDPVDVALLGDDVHHVALLQYGARLRHNGLAEPVDVDDARAGRRLGELDRLADPLR